MSVTAYIGLGSNLDEPQRQIDSAIAAIAQLAQTQLIRSAPRYQSTAIGPGPQADYINTVIAVETSLSPMALLGRLQTIEQLHKRERSVRWGPRTLDLDILLYGDTIVQLPTLTVPHPRLKERSFVVYPLHDIAPGLILPDGTVVAHLLANSNPQGIVQLSAGEHCGSTG